MEKLNRDRTQMRRAFTKAANEAKCLIEKEDKQNSEVRKILDILEDKANRMFKMDEEIKEIYLSEDPFDENAFEREFDSAETYRNNWISIKNDCEDILNRLPSLPNDVDQYMKMVRMISWMQRFVYNSLHCSKKMRGELTLEEVQEAEGKLFRCIQKECFQNEGAKVLEKMQTFKDDKGTIRIRTKLLHGDETNEFQFPVVLPGKHTIVRRKASIAELLHRLLDSDAKWVWLDSHTVVFNKLKNLISSDSVLVPFDETLPILLTCDASPYGVGAVLSHQLPDGREAPIAFSSRTLTSTERNYAQIDKEALSIISGVKKFHNFLYGHHFTLITDHQPLLVMDLLMVLLLLKTVWIASCEVDFYEGLEEGMAECNEAFLCEIKNYEMLRDMMQSGGPKLTKMIVVWMREIAEYNAPYEDSVEFYGNYAKHVCAESEERKKEIYKEHVDVGYEFYMDNCANMQSEECVKFINFLWEQQSSMMEFVAQGYCHKLMKVLPVPEEMKEIAEASSKAVNAAKDALASVTNIFG
ncbi:hypothetical protein JTE90_026398 [Oedothorax gibbosus]|uniref:Reverse transcriptase/retrotransposon-derived protein RNase H-like domain-containing protein n=1 Tax=Oedothorax gibbosus TaxID=931172 RepID=A0AAV6VDT0_9ARAC|nr:hypothetical protein JTE90_026398 [Oedothorax gibbosus]